MAATIFFAVNCAPGQFAHFTPVKSSIKTLAASGIADFDKMQGFNEKHAPLRRNVTIEEVGNVSAFLCSDLASGVTGEITYVDGGMNITAAGIVD